MTHLLSLSGGEMSERTGRAVQVKQGPKRVRAYLNGQVVADTYTPLLVWEIPYYPTYYIPMPDIKAELIPSGESEHKPGLGDAEIFH
jgi:uncharacterized protein (DUF427 family)